MFVTYEGSTIITWASIKNLRRNPQTDEYTTGITGGNGLGGMGVDGSLYVISRDTSRLYAFAYDTYENTLIPVPLDAGHVYQELEDVTTGIDIAIDETGSSIMGFPVGRLYVSDLSETVRYYNMVTWQKEGRITLDRSAIGIGLDKTRGYLYGGYFDGGGGANYLMRYDLDGDPNDQETYLEQDLGAPVMDIAVDEDTGYLYLTLMRLHDGLTGIVEVYDPTNWISTDANSLVLLDTESDTDFVSEGPGGIAVGPSYKPPRMFLEKVDNVSECVLPDDQVVYSIVVRPGDVDETNVVVTDWVPVGVAFVSADPNDGYYDADAHAYVWEVGYLPGYDPNDPSDPNVYLTLTVQVNDWAEPAADLINIAQAESNEAYTEVKAPTPVCCWGGDVIFVDMFAVGAETGVDWPNAYTDLQDALLRAGGGCGYKIWVAQGVYSPGNDVEDTFEIPDGIAVYGGFCGTEITRDERDWTQYKTVLSGVLTNETVAMMGQGSRLDGLVVEEATLYGIKGTNVAFSVANCVVRANGWHGIYGENGSVAVWWSEVKDNGEYGIYQIGANRSLEVYNSRIHDNAWDGILADSSNVAIKNSIISGNGSDGDNYGIRLRNPAGGAVVHNNTIVHNGNEGIAFVGEYMPDVRNCILWGNDTNQLLGLDEDSVYYCDIEDCNDINAGNNINDDPEFSYSQEAYGLYHLAVDSPCIDAGDNTYVDPNGTGEWDIDADDRIVGDYVDIGADEFACEELTHPLDWTFDGIVDLEELVIFTDAWLSHDPNDPLGDPEHPDYVSDPNSPDYIYPGSLDHYDLRCDFDEDMDVDMADWGYFAYYWRWRACWRTSSYGVWAMGEGGTVQGMMQPETLAIAQPLATADSAQAIEPSIEEQCAHAKEIVEWFEDLWKNDAEARKVIDKKDWKRFMNKLYEWLANTEQAL